MITEYYEEEYYKDQMLTEPETKGGKKSILDQPPKEHIPVVQPLIWQNVIGIPVLFAITFYLFVAYAIFPPGAKLWTWIFGFIYGLSGGFGLTSGIHRYWAHRSYNAKLPLKIMLACFFCTTGQIHMFKWIRTHRTHHRYTDTCADPHNANRGFFFSHVGWLMMKHHPAVKEYGKNVDMSDIAADPVIRFFDKYYPLIMPTLTFILPTVIPAYFWNERWIICVTGTMTRWVVTLNIVFTVNSVAHLWGTQPYNKHIMAKQNKIIAFLTFGEGWHNYHHCFPWDYKLSEHFNAGAAFIDVMAWLGFACDLKTTNSALVEKFYKEKGDGSHKMIQTNIPQI